MEIMIFSEDDNNEPFKEKYLILYYKDKKWRIRSIRAESAAKAEEHFRYGPMKTKGAEFYEVYVFTGINDYV